MLPRVCRAQAQKLASSKFGSLGHRREHKLWLCSDVLLLAKPHGGAFSSKGDASHCRRVQTRRAGLGSSVAAQRPPHPYLTSGCV